MASGKVTNILVQKYYPLITLKGMHVNPVKLPGKVFYKMTFMTKKTLTHVYHVYHVVFKAVFDTTWRGAVWKMLRSIWVDPKIKSLNEAMHGNDECAVIINGQLTGWFRVEI